MIIDSRIDMLQGWQNLALIGYVGFTIKGRGMVVLVIADPADGGGWTYISAAEAEALPGGLDEPTRTDLATYDPVRSFLLATFQPESKPMIRRVDALDDAVRPAAVYLLRQDMQATRAA